jgi:hypothetical protein
MIWTSVNMKFQYFATSTVATLPICIGMMRAVKNVAPPGDEQLADSKGWKGRPKVWTRQLISLLRWDHDQSGGEFWNGIRVQYDTQGKEMVQGGQESWRRDLVQVLEY